MHQSATVTHRPGKPDMLFQHAGVKPDKLSQHAGAKQDKLSQHAKHRQAIPACTASHCIKGAARAQKQQE